MKKSLRLLASLLPSILIPSLFVTFSAQAQYNSYNVSSGADTIVQAYRSVNVPSGIGSFGIGTLSLSSTLSLAGNTIMKISKNGGSISNDLASVTGTLTYGGALIVTNINNSAFAAGDSFKLFNASAYAGNFTSITLPTLPSNLMWNTNNLAVNGSISIITNAGGSPNIRSSAIIRTSPPLTISNVAFDANHTSITVTGTGTAGQSYILLSTTNLSTPMWLPIATNTADGNGLLQFTGLPTAHSAQQFYRLTSH